MLLPVYHTSVFPSDSLPVSVSFRSGRTPFVLNPVCMRACCSKKPNYGILSGKLTRGERRLETTEKLGAKQRTPWTARVRTFSSVHVPIQGRSTVIHSGYCRWGRGLSGSDGGRPSVWQLLFAVWPVLESVILVRTGRAETVFVIFSQAHYTQRILGVGIHGNQVCLAKKKLIRRGGAQQQGCRSEEGGGCPAVRGRRQ